jgi:hypothetical protein
MDDSAFNFCINDNFNANYDITWSFQYSVSGSNVSTGGFSTFLFQNPILSGGGRYTGMGYSPYLMIPGVSGAVLGIMFGSDNIVRINQGSNFASVTSFPLFNELHPFVKQTERFFTIRFNLTDLGKTLKIALKKNNVLDYKTIKTINLDIPISVDTFFKVGFSYATPFSFNENKIKLKLKDIHVQGNKNIPNTTYKKKPLEITSYYLLQSPASAKIQIQYKDPTTSGYLLHK